MPHTSCAQSLSRILQEKMFRIIIPLTIFACVLALPAEIREKRDDAKSDQIAFPQETDEKVNLNSTAPAGNGTDLDNRFLGVGIGLGLAVGQKLLGHGHGYHGGKY